ncbi:Alpha/Beta hydrolase protein [Rhodofomes roseus]|uniref:Alpha/Beta hydrolase protein n=1 Tax=Rhodofomes roseus TaxID=34475 RepID=A0ABQ8KAY9_9APHY|nr:Alpha/Beta hydrolase protein [Rhodofomes roseus]KAH9834553.1 Alpha/Beta hydrolase protein [Rhodofomes roseus]
MSESTGTVDFTVGSETFQTWYKVVGDIDCGVRPLVILHGGPGFPHIYVRCHTRLWESRGIPVVLYDQLGCGGSTRLRDKPKEFWTFELLIAELENLVTKLGIQDNFDVLGHSWGGALAASYRLVLANTYASMHLWETGCRELIEMLPGDDMQITIAELEKDNTVYLAIEFGRHGPSEFYCTGNQKNFDIVDRLHDIQQSTLVINGANDQATDMCVAPLFWRIPNAKWVQFSQATHQPFFEEPERYFELVGEFLTMQPL